MATFHITFSKLVLEPLKYTNGFFFFKDNRKAELESALKEDKDFYQSFDHIQLWLNDMEGVLSHEFPISADQDVLKRQVQEFQVRLQIHSFAHINLEYALVEIISDVPNSRSPTRKCWTRTTKYTSSWAKEPTCCRRSHEKQKLYSFKIKWTQPSVSGRKFEKPPTIGILKKKQEFCVFSKCQSYFPFYYLF